MSNIFVGVGGTGCGVLLGLAKKIEESQAILEKMKQRADSVFWAIDADAIQANVNVPNFHTTELRVLNAGQSQTTDYRSEKDEHFRRWFDPLFRTTGHINSRTAPGAGQIKMNGRYAGYYEVRKLVSAMQAIQPAGFDAAHSRVYIVASLFGGTGAGLLFDVAYLIRENLSTDVRLYLLEPSVLEIWDPGRAQVHAWKGGYASLLELDFWMMNNAERSRDRQFDMIYKGGYGVEHVKADPPGVPVFLFGGTDPDGRSLGQTGKDVLGAYKEFIADVLFETAFNEAYRRTDAKNQLDNLASTHQSDLSSGHSRGFASSGLTYLRFPREKVREYAVQYCLHRIVVPSVATGRSFHTEEMGREVVDLLKSAGVEDKENHQVTSQLEDIPLWKQIGEAGMAFQKTVRTAKDNKQVPDRGVALQFDKLEEEVARLMEALANGGSLTLAQSRRELEGFNSRLKSKVFGMMQFQKRVVGGGGGEKAEVVEARSFADVGAFLEGLELHLRGQQEHLKKSYFPKLDRFEKEKVATELETQFKRLRGTKNAWPFGKEFDNAKILYIKKLDDYIEGRRIKAFYQPAMAMYERLLGEVKRWNAAVQYVADRVNDVYGDAENRMKRAHGRFRDGLFIYDSVLGGVGQNYVFDLSVGDNAEIVESKMMADRVLPYVSSRLPEMRRELLDGMESTRGLMRVALDAYAQDSRRRGEGKVKEEYNQALRDLFGKVVLQKVEDCVDGIKFAEVLEWQLQAIFGYVKGLYDQRRDRKTDYERALGAMRAMFGDTGTSALVTTFDGRIEVSEWVRMATSELVRNVRSMVRPMWKLGPEGRNKELVAINNVIYPMGWPARSLLKTGESQDGAPPEDSISEWYDDRIVFLVTDLGIALSELEPAVLADLRAKYEAERAAKMGPAGRGRPPYHSDYRFYNEWQWSLEKEEGQQAERGLLLQLATALLLCDHGGELPIIVRKKNKSTSVFNLNTPSSPFNGKAEVRLGDSLPKSYDKLGKDAELRAHFDRLHRSAMEYKLVTAPDPKLDAVRAFLVEVQKQWEALRPPNSGKARASKERGMSGNDAYNLWDLGDRWLSELQSKLTEANYRKYLLE
jgi:hypothetical protein